MNNSFGPLIHALPLTLASKTFDAGGTPSPRAERVVEEHEMTEPNGKKSNTYSREERDTETVGLTEDAKAGNRAARIKSEEEYGFAHPAASRPQRIVWFPRDRLGLAEEEERACVEGGVDASLKDAEMSERGKVDIMGAPPDLVLDE